MDELKDKNIEDLPKSKNGEYSKRWRERNKEKVKEYKNKNKKRNAEHCKNWRLKNKSNYSITSKEIEITNIVNTIDLDSSDSLREELINKRKIKEEERIKRRIEAKNRKNKLLIERKRIKFERKVKSKEEAAAKKKEYIKNWFKSNKDKVKKYQDKYNESKKAESKLIEDKSNTDSIGVGNKLLEDGSFKLKGNRSKNRNLALEALLEDD